MIVVGVRRSCWFVVVSFHVCAIKCQVVIITFLDSENAKHFSKFNSSSNHHFLSVCNIVMLYRLINLSSHTSSIDYAKYYVLSY